MGRDVPQPVTDEARRTKVFDRSVPLHVRGTSGAIRGELFWRGAQSGAPVGAYAGLTALALLGGATAVVVRRRRRRASTATAAARPRTRRPGDPTRCGWR